MIKEIKENELLTAPCVSPPIKLKMSIKITTISTKIGSPRLYFILITANQ